MAITTLFVYFTRSFNFKTQYCGNGGNGDDCDDWGDNFTNE
jgi:hypothetical protein